MPSKAKEILANSVARLVDRKLGTAKSIDRVLLRSVPMVPPDDCFLLFGTSLLFGTAK